MLSSGVRRRLAAHGWSWFVVWPEVSVFAGSIELLEFVKGIFEKRPFSLPLILANKGLILFQVIPAGCFAVLRLLPLFAAVGGVGWLASVALFGVLPERRERPRAELLFEPLLLAAAAAAGIAWEYPAVLRHPFLFFLRGFPVFHGAMACTFLVLACAGLLGLRRRGARGCFTLTAIMGSVIFLSWRFAMHPRSRGPLAPPRDSVLLLGIDSLSQLDEVSILKDFVKRAGGRWYEKPVTPSLFTNAVWTSILTRRFPDESGIFLPGQSAAWREAPFNLVREAEKRGFATWSKISVQSSTYVGSEAGVRFDRSGPIGWLQLAVFIKNASVFLALAGNQAESFSYDLRDEVRSILETGSGRGENLVIAHLEFLHDPQYPPLRLLSGEERRAVWGAPIAALRDASLDWQYPETKGEPLGIYSWKLRYFQRVLVEEMVASGFLARERRNRLILFSDHGGRRDVGMDNFCLPRYHRVVLASFGVQPRDPRKPISLLDIPELAGFPDRTRPGPAEPAIFYSFPQDLRDLVSKGSGLRVLFNGRFVLDEGFVAEFRARLRKCRPY